ncbi:hypothetical protein [Actinoplanes palleronii]|uniref:Uncharacterized protein n=1 Tax=Actinoplanes palleronii TaxID=113570 RepID=A0ABQ4BPH2_9ACTN|nr:hypothetical protein [Actinoplanes palleronii]GIE72569.1 hypothetical protein Apa02nite_086770 [Actinoplanes palleronii]
MGLTIHIIRDLPDGRFVMEEPPYGIYDGVSSVRLWTSPVVAELGATYLPQLGDGYLRIRPEETGAFLRECATLLIHAAEIAAANLGGTTQETRQHYVEGDLSTMIFMTHCAGNHHDGGILIWG